MTAAACGPIIYYFSTSGADVNDMATVLYAKLLVLGSSAVGKTALCQSFQNDGTHFSKNYNMTTNVDILVKSMKVPGTKYNVEFLLIDTPSKDCFSQMVHKFYNNASLLAMVYDITNIKSFEECTRLFNEIKAIKTTPSLASLPCVLIGNKSDLSQQRKVTTKEGEALAKKFDAELFECSVKEMQNVDSPFIYLADIYCKKYEKSLEYFSTLG